MIEHQRHVTINHNITFTLDIYINVVYQLLSTSFIKLSITSKIYEKSYEHTYKKLVMEEYISEVTGLASAHCLFCKQCFILFYPSFPRTKGLIIQDSIER